MAATPPQASDEGGVSRSGRSRRRAPRLTWPALVVVCALVALGALATSGFHLVTTGSTRTSAPTAAPGSPQRFTDLAAAHTNACLLQRATVDGYADDMRMHGACCNAMDMTKYRYQVENLRPYARILEIPTDPYDIRAGLAKQLFRFDDSIVLTSADKATFSAAMEMTKDKAPCCCHCWRWLATEGLDKFLITVHQFTAAQVARITDLVNGCGGPLDVPSATSSGGGGP